MPYDPYYSRGGYYYPPPIPLAREKETVNIFNENGRGRDYDQGYIDAMHRLNMSGSRSRSRSRHRSHSHSRHRSRSRSSVDREIDRLRKDLHHMEEKDVLEAREKELKLRWEVEIASKKDKEKSELEKMRAKVKFEEIMEKEKAEREYKEFEILQAKKKVEKELKEKKEKEAADAAARTTMRAIGWSDTQIDRAIAVRDREKVKETTIVTTTPVLYGGGHHHHHHGQMVLGGPRAPVYPRAHVKDIHIEVLKKYKIDWRYDTVSFPSLQLKPHNTNDSAYRTRTTSSSSARWTKHTSKSSTKSPGNVSRKAASLRCCWSRGRRSITAALVDCRW